MRCLVTKVVWVGLVLVGGACGMDLPVPSLIDSVRVLGIQADRPEVGPGETVNLTALLVNVPEDATVQMEWTACVLPERGTGPLGGGGETGEGGGGGYGLSDGGTCVDLLASAPDSVIDLGKQTSVSVTIPEDFLSDGSNTARAYGLPLDAPLPEAALAGLHSIAGVNLTVTLVVTVDGESWISLKRINVSTAAEKNTNPSDMVFHLQRKEEAPKEAPEAAALLSDGSCLTTEHGGVLSVSPGTYYLSALNVPETPVEYEVLSIGNTEQGLDITTAKETYYYSVFSTLGEFGLTIVKSTGSRRASWKLPKSEAGTDGFLWVVTRDGRGGIDWCEQPITVQNTP